MGEVNNDKLAQRAMLAGAIVTLLALGVVPLAFENPLWPVFNASTGVVGDTIGGIAGQILNFAGLIVVYYSLREQILSNKQQFTQLQHEVERSRNEREFELSFK